MTTAQQKVLWRVAQFKHGWSYVSGIGQQSASRALARRGFVGVVIDHTGFAIEITDAGRAEVALRWPNSPLNLGTYDTPTGGWDKP